MGISIALFNQVSKVAIFPLVSITTSFVAEEETIEKINTKAMESGKSESATLTSVENPKNDSTEKGEIDEKERPTLEDGMQLLIRFDRSDKMDK